MPGDDALKARGVERTCFDKLKQAGLGGAPRIHFSVSAFGISALGRRQELFSGIFFAQSVPIFACVRGGSLARSRSPRPRKFPCYDWGWRKKFCRGPARAGVRERSTM